MTPMIMNPFRFASVAASTEFASMYESRSALTVIQKQHFVEWFSGSALDSIWTATPNGASTQVMDDAVDGGYLMTCGTSASDNIRIDFNNVNQYSKTASVMIFVMKITDQAGQGNNLTGWSNVASVASNNNVSHLGHDRFTTNYNLITRGTGSATTTNSSVPVDTAWHTHKIENAGTDVVLYVDGVSEATNTTNLSTADFQPSFGIQSDATDTPTMSIRYLECYNT